MDEVRVLVVTDRLRARLRDSLREGGAAPVVAGSQIEAIVQLRRHRFEAVVVDREHAEVDPLELVLNVRDFNATIPIVVVGLECAEPGLSVLRQQPCTLALDRRNLKRLPGELGLTDAR